MFSNITFKHRLIGTIFLVSLAVIIIPALFDKPTVDTLVRQEFVPAPDHIAVQELDKVDYAFTELTQKLALETESEPVIEPVPNPAPEFEFTSVPESEPVPESSFISVAESEPTPALESKVAAVTESEPAPIPALEPKLVSAPKSEPVPNKPAVIAIPAFPPESDVIAQTEKLITASGWAVQVGAFSKVANAQSLLEQLQSKGYTAHIQHMNDTKLTRVLVGTKPDKAQAMVLLSELDKTMHLKGIVVKFNPETAG